MRTLRVRFLVFVAVACIAVAAPAARSDEPNLSKEEIRQFLLTAKVVKSRNTGKGITSPYRLTLSDGKLTHDAAFQSVDEHKSSAQLARGGTELNFVDSYKYNIAGYILAELLGLDDMVPVTVERKWEGKTGALSWWLPSRMDEIDRRKQKIQVGDPERWNEQIFKIRVLNQLVYDTDFNQTNMLIGYDWKVWKIDFTRAFRRHKELPDPKELERCEKQLLENLKTLDAAELERRTQGFLNKAEIQGVMARRDKIVAHFEKLIAEKGEGAVLY